MSNIPTVLPKPPQLVPGSQSFNRRWSLLNKWYGDLIQALSKALSIVGQDFDAINTQVGLATGLPISVGGALTVLASGIVTVTDITQMIMVVGNVTLKTDAGNDPVVFALFRGATQIAGDYLPAVGAGATVSKTLIGIDSSLSVGQYSYALEAQTAGGGGNTIVSAAQIGLLVI